MGEAFTQESFSENDEKIFFQTLRKETLELKKMFESRLFEFSENPKIGLEIEGCLVDQRGYPAAKNSEFLKVVNNQLVVEEISKFNFEINVPPEKYLGDSFSNLLDKVTGTWQECVTSAERLNLKLLIIGTQPLLNESHLCLDNMTEKNRYFSLNKRLINLKDNKKVVIDITGSENSIKKNYDNIMAEAAATSIQVHLQTNQENLKRVYNASLVASSLLVAISANSPFFNGQVLWDETRIPLFESSVKVPSFRNKKGEDKGRVTFGTGYIRHSGLEIYLENLDGYIPLLPVLFKSNPTQLRHLNFHNGTIWRWTRPIVGFNSAEHPHLRIEQRVMSSGPTLIDMIANTAFAVGLIDYLSQMEKPPEESLTFTDCTENFYQAAKASLLAKIKWGGKTISITDLFSELLPKVNNQLKKMGIDSDSADFYINEVIGERVRQSLNGALWQKMYFKYCGNDLKEVTLAYLENQNEGKPVHLWKKYI